MNKYEALFEKAKPSEKESNWEVFERRREEASLKFFELLPDFSNSDFQNRQFKSLKKEALFFSWSGNALFESEDGSYVLKIFCPDLQEAFEEALAESFFNRRKCPLMRIPKIIKAAKSVTIQGQKKIFFLFEKVRCETFDTLILDVIKGGDKSKVEKSFHLFGRSLKAWHGSFQKEIFPAIFWKQGLIRLFEESFAILSNHPEDPVPLDKFKKYFYEKLEVFSKTPIGRGFMHGDLHFGNFGICLEKEEGVLFDLSLSSLSISKNNNPFGFPLFDVQRVLDDLDNALIFGLDLTASQAFKAAFLKGYVLDKHFESGPHTFYYLIETLQNIYRFLGGDKDLELKDYGLCILKKQLESYRDFL